MAEVKNTIELNIYDDDLELIKTYKTYGIRWKAFKQITAMQDELDALKEASDDESVEKMNEIMRLIYPKITDEELGEVFTSDLFNCFNQAVNLANEMAKNS